jgi:hypothetical protein
MTSSWPSGCAKRRTRSSSKRSCRASRWSGCSRPTTRTAARALCHQTHSWIDA